MTRKLKRMHRQHAHVVRSCVQICFKVVLALRQQIHNFCLFRLLRLDRGRMLDQHPTLSTAASLFEGKFVLLIVGRFPW